MSQGTDEPSGWQPHSHLEYQLPAGEGKNIIQLVCSKGVGAFGHQPSESEANSNGSDIARFLLRAIKRPPKKTDATSAGQPPASTRFTNAVNALWKSGPPHDKAACHGCVGDECRLDHQPNPVEMKARLVEHRTPQLENIQPAISGGARVFAARGKRLCCRPPTTQWLI